MEPLELAGFAAAAEINIRAHLICTHRNERSQKTEPNHATAWYKRLCPATAVDKHVQAMHAFAPVMSHRAEPVLPVFSGVRAALSSSSASGIVTAPPLAACNLCSDPLLLPCSHMPLDYKRSLFDWTKHA